MVVASVSAGVGACADGTDGTVAEVPTAVVVVGEMDSESGLGIGLVLELPAGAAGADECSSVI